MMLKSDAPARSIAFGPNLSGFNTERATASCPGNALPRLTDESGQTRYLLRRPRTRSRRHSCRRRTRPSDRGPFAGITDRGVRKRRPAGLIATGPFHAPPPPTHVTVSALLSTTNTSVWSRLNCRLAHQGRPRRERPRRADRGGALPGPSATHPTHRQCSIVVHGEHIGLVQAELPRGRDRRRRQERSCRADRHRPLPRCAGPSPTSRSALRLYSRQTHPSV